jgi:DNA-binding response OmpR family regulator
VSWTTEAPKVLVVADDREAGELLSRLVDQAGWRSNLAFSIDVAVEELADASPAYVGIVVDMAADAGAGNLEMLQRTRAVPGAPGATPVVICSWRDDIRGQAWTSGTDGFLTRPFRADDLIEQLRAAIERPAAERDAHRQYQIGLSVPDAPA